MMGLRYPAACCGVVHFERRFRHLSDDSSEGEFNSITGLTTAKDVRRRLSRYSSPGRRPHNPMVRRPSFYELLDRFKSFSDFISTAFCKTRSKIAAAVAITAEPKVMRMPIKTPPARSSLLPNIM